jgi:adenine/guanine phosphoribosyltransferase-like PRPP-binding protein
MRLRATESQAGLTLHERSLNVRGAFTVSDPAVVASKHILLIDDIFTTGATVRAAAKALVRAGAASVWVATLARARRTSGRRYVPTDNAEDNDKLSSYAGAAEMQHDSNFSSQDKSFF